MTSSLSKNEDEIDTYLGKRLNEFGITRLANTTGLDYIGVPTYSCVCPGSTDTIWVYSGKGLTLEHARISAIMECIERTSSLWNQERVIVASYSTLSKDSLVWGPDNFTECVSPHYSNDKPIAWIRANHLLNDSFVWVPADLVFNGRRQAFEIPSAFQVSTSNGLGAGLSKKQAIIQALGELIERDAISCIELRSSHFGAAFILNLSHLLGMNESLFFEQFRDNTDLALTITPASLPIEASAIYKRYHDAGLNVQIKYIPNDFGVPVFGAAAVEVISFNSVLATAGYGASLNPMEAICRALLELAQSRATDRQGGREDCGYEEKDRLQDPPFAHWLAEPSSRAIDYATLVEQMTTKPITVKNLLSCLSTAGLNDVAIVNFETYEGIFVVRAVVPEIETWHATGGSSRLGQRMRRHFR